MKRGDIVPPLSNKVESVKFLIRDKTRPFAQVVRLLDEINAERTKENILCVLAGKSSAANELFMQQYQERLNAPGRDPFVVEDEQRNLDRRFYEIYNKYAADISQGDRLTEQEAEVVEVRDIASARPSLFIDEERIMHVYAHELTEEEAEHINMIETICGLVNDLLSKTGAIPDEYMYYSVFDKKYKFIPLVLNGRCVSATAKARMKK